MKFFHFATNFTQGLALGLVATAGLVFFSMQAGLIAPIRAYVILSGSMEPQIPVGSVVVVQKSPLYAVGDIITYAPGGNMKELVTHRIVEANRGPVYYGTSLYKTQGDTNDTPDQWDVEEGHIQGKVFLTVPHIGYLGHFAKTPKGFIALVIIPATIIVYEEFKSLGKELSGVGQKIAQRFKMIKLKAPPLPSESYKLAFLIPIVAGGLYLTTSSRSFFNDAEHVSNNVFGAAAIYPSSSPTTNPSPTPTPSLTPTPTGQEIPVNL